MDSIRPNCSEWIKVQEHGFYLLDLDLQVRHGFSTFLELGRDWKVVGSVDERECLEE